jgi:cytochrome bd-type quinol oxidase subunit 2
MDPASVAAVLRGEEAFGNAKLKRHWWEAIIVLAAIGIFIWLGLGATRQEIVVNLPWMTVLTAISMVCLVACGTVLWRRTRFS